MRRLKENFKIFNGLLAVIWFIVSGVSVLLFMDLLKAFIDPVLHTPVLWSVNVYRFAWSALGLYAGGVVWGSFLIYFLALIKGKNDREKYAKLIEDLKKEAR